MKNARFFLYAANTQVYAVLESIAQNPLFHSAQNISPVLEACCAGNSIQETFPQSISEIPYRIFLGTARNYGISPFADQNSEETFTGKQLQGLYESGQISQVEKLAILGMLVFTADPRTRQILQHEIPDISENFWRSLYVLADRQKWNAAYEQNVFFVEKTFCDELIQLIAAEVKPEFDQITKLDGLSPGVYQVPMDQVIYRRIMGIPGIPSMVAKGVDTFARQREMMLLANSQLITPQTQPRLYKLLKTACIVLDFKKIPNLFVDTSLPGINAYTTGSSENAYIGISQNAIVFLDDRELLYLLGHELGHIQCNHVVLHTLADLILDNAGIIPVVGHLASAAIRPLLGVWLRYCELSADRAGMLCCQNQEAALRAMMKLGGHPFNSYDTLHTRSLLDQVAEFEKMLQDSGVNRFWNALNIGVSTHPYLIYRAYELLNWIRSGMPDDILSTDAAGRQAFAQWASQDPMCCRICSEIESFMTNWFVTKKHLSRKAAAREIRTILFSGTRSHVAPFNMIFKIGYTVEQIDVDEFQYKGYFQFATEEGGLRMESVLNIEPERDYVPKEVREEMFRTDQQKLEKVLFEICD